MHSQVGGRGKGRTHSRSNDFLAETIGRREIEMFSATSFSFLLPTFEKRHFLKIDYTAKVLGNY